MSTKDLDQALASFNRLQPETARRVLSFFRTRAKKPQLKRRQSRSTLEHIGLVAVAPAHRWDAGETAAHSSATIGQVRTPSIAKMFLFASRKDGL